ncbi:MAG: response regulator [Desulfobacteraceae bacterium]|nr:MAG: response regulator [Desulfobacteraceae bacterium]
MTHDEQPIIVIEDDHIIRDMLKSMIEQWGMRVHFIMDESAAVDTIKSLKTPHIIILDWILRGISGIEICKAVREVPDKIPHYIIFLTGKSLMNDIKEGLESGADDYISKPFDQEELKARVQVGLRMIRLQHETIERERLQGVLEMAATICHEINQPLMGISGLSELVLQDAKGNKKIIENIKKIKDQADRLGQITGKLMNITRYETRKYLKRNMIDIDKASGKGSVTNNGG